MSKHSKKGYSFICLPDSEEMSRKTWFYSIIYFTSGSTSYSLLIYQVYWPATIPKESNAIKIDLEQRSNVLSEDIIVSVTLKLLASKVVISPVKSGDKKGNHV